MSQPSAQPSNIITTQYGAPGAPLGASPTDQHAYAQPPAKRQRMSPEAQSPIPQSNGIYRASPVSTPGGYGNPYAPGAPQYQQYSPQVYSPAAFNTPEPFSGHPGQRQQWGHHNTPHPQPQRSMTAASPPSSSAMMPPPPKPNREERDERVGVDDINDAMWSSGVNLKEEENYMHNMYQTRYAANDSFATQSGSFGGSTQPGNSFSLLTQSTSFGSTGAGTLGSAVTETAVDEELTHKRTIAARDKAERQQYELRNPFLLGNSLRLRIDKIAREQGVRVASEGVYVAPPEARVMTNGSGSEGIVAARLSAATVDPTAPFADILALVSLASGERLRGLLNDSHGLARARRYGDHGRVPVDFADVATGLGKAASESIKQESITDTAWDAVPDSARESKQSSISFQSMVNNSLRGVAKRDQDAEKRRLAKREARRKNAEATADDTMDDSIVDVKASLAADLTPAAAKITKKELARQQKEKASFSEAQAATSTNQTAALALGKKGQRYNWMNQGAASMTTNRFAKPVTSTGGSGTGTPNKKDGTRTPVVGKDADGKSEMVWGEWREDSAGGKGIQIRDWLLVLERDGRQKQAWETALLKIDDLAQPPPAPNPVVSSITAPQTPSGTTANGILPPAVTG